MNNSSDARSADHWEIPALKVGFILAGLAITITGVSYLIYMEFPQQWLVWIVGTAFIVVGLVTIAWSVGLSFKSNMQNNKSQKFLILSIPAAFVLSSQVCGIGLGACSTVCHITNALLIIMGIMVMIRLNRSQNVGLLLVPMVVISLTPHSYSTEPRKEGNVMKRILLGMLVVVSFAGMTYAQDPGDPLGAGREFGNGANGVVLLTRVASGQSAKHVLYGFATAGNGLSSRFTHSTSGQMTMGTTGESGIATGDLTGDGFDEIASVWKGSDGRIKLMVTPVNPLANSWPAYLAAQESLSIGAGNGGGVAPWNVHATIGKFGADGQKELLVSYWGAGGHIIHRLYSVSKHATTGRIILTQVAIDSSIYLDPNLGESARFDVAAGDFDGDYQDEFAMVVVGLLPARYYNLYVQLYDIAGSSIMKKALVGPVYSVNQDTYAYNLSYGEGYQYEGVDICAADLDGDDNDEVVVSTQVRESNWSQALTWNYDNKYLAFVKSLHINPDLSGGSVLATVTWVQDWYNILYGVFNIDFRRYPGTQTGLCSGDLDGDGSDEVVWHRNQALVVLENTSLSVSRTYENFVNAPAGGGTCASSIFDLDTVGYSPHQAELMVADWASGGSITIFRATSSGGTITGLSTVRQIGNLGYDVSIEVAAGDFDGAYFKLGAPAHYTVMDFVQPTVIVKAPPTHFDVLADTVYDIPGCYPVGTGTIASNYVQQATTDTTVQLTFTRDWGVSASVGGGLSAFGVSVKAGLSVSYGEQFSRDETHRTTTTVIEGVSASTDDQVLSTTLDYDLYEYPLLDGNGATADKLLVVDPKPATKRWTGGKSPLSNFYVPYHEVGNIFSYLPEDSMNTYSFIDLDVGAGSGQPIGDGSTHDWSIYQSNFGSSAGMRSRAVGLAVGASISAWGLEASVQASYARSEISTQITSVQRDFQLRFATGAYTTPEYQITPHVYWATNGALVLDYSADIPQAVPGQDPTFWDVHYGQQADPAFSLPWRYDALKGLSTTFPPNFTRDISFLPAHAQIYDTVTVRARVRNYSLQATSGPVSASFYIGDPSQGGELIESADLKTTFSTDGPIGPRGWALIEFEWIVPPTIPTNPRIYGLLDPSNTLSEIHEENNKAYAVLLVTGTSAVEEPGGTVPAGYELSQNYPNPFNAQTTIRFVLPTSVKVKLELYNLLGQKVATPIDDTMMAGYHVARIDASALPSGVYLYRLSAGEFTQVIKMIVLK